MGRTVVISGGGTGIGFAAAETFAADGDQVVLLGRRITVNAVAPGLIDDTPFFGEPLTEERLRLRAEETVTGRVGVPGDVTSLLHFLASDKAGHITAQVLQVNGGAESSR